MRRFRAAARAPPPRRKVEYASGIAVGTGQIVTSREALEGCYVVTVARHRRRGSRGRGQGERARAVARLRRGSQAGDARALRPRKGDVTLVGVADPQAQGGGSAVSAVKARVSDALALDPAPALGFDGAAALDAQGRLAGIAVAEDSGGRRYRARPERDRDARRRSRRSAISSMRRTWRPPRVAPREPTPRRPRSSG